MKKIVEGIKNLFSFSMRDLLSVDKVNLIKKLRTIPFLLIVLSSFIFVFIFLIIEWYSFSSFSKFYRDEQIEQKRESLKKSLIEDIRNYKKDILNVDKDIQKKVKNRLYMAYRIANNIYDAYHPLKDKVEIEGMIAEALRDIRFKTKDSFFYLYDYNGHNVLNPKYPSEEDKNTLNKKDAFSNYIIKNSIELLRKKDERSFYLSYKNKKLLVYIKRFDPLKIFIFATIDYNDLKKSKIKQIEKKYKNLKVLPNSVVELRKYINSLIKNDNSEKAKKSREKFFATIAKGEIASLTYTTFKKVKDDKYGWFKNIIKLLPIFSFQEESKSILVTILDKNRDKKKNRYQERIYLKIEPVTKIFKNSDKAKAFMQKQAFEKAVVIVILFLITAIVISNIIFKKFSPVISKIIKDLNLAEKDRDFNKKFLADVLEYYPYPLIRYNEAKKVFTINEAFKKGADFKPYYIDQDKASTTKIVVPDIPQNKDEKK